MKNNKIKILFVNKDAYCYGYCFDNLEERGLDFELDKDCHSQFVVRRNNAGEYDIAIIDVSDDILIDEKRTLSQYLRMKNKRLIIVGTSVQRHILSDKLSTELYDERKHILYQKLDEVILDVLKKYNFKIPEEVEKK